MTDLVSDAMAGGWRVLGFPVREYCREIGQHGNFRQAALELHSCNQGPDLEGAGTWSGRRVLVRRWRIYRESSTEALVRLGAQTRAFCRYTSRNSRGWLEHSEVSSDVEFVHGDIRDPDSVLAAARGVDVVFHLAALIGIPYSYDVPRSYVATNVMGTLNVLDAARRLELDRVVNTSTSEVYGTAKFVPIDEQHPLQAQSPYSASKIAADKLANPISVRSLVRS